MHNPSYLVTSRHNIFYFRYPLPVSLGCQAKRVSISLGTREPKKALQLANMLAYHTEQLLNTVSASPMDYSDIQALVTTMMRKWIAHAKQKIDKDGPLTKAEVAKRQEAQEMTRQCIEHDTYTELAHFIGEEEAMQYDKGTLEALGIEATPDNYSKYIKAYAFGFIEHHEAVLEYNTSKRTNNLEPSPTARTEQPRKVHTLGELVEQYLEEYTLTVAPKTVKERGEHISYLIELYGADYDIQNVNDDTAREVKECLRKTPSNRNKKKNLKTLPLRQQIDKKGYDVLSVRSVNKYLKAHIAFFEWVKNDKYIKENPFSGMSVKTARVEKERENFKAEEVRLILTELEKKSYGLANNDMKYWGTLLLLHTGARLEEVASLQAADIKQDSNGVWYIELTDHKKSKRIKKHFIRLVPVHSTLITKGFIDYVNKVKEIKCKDVRLLYELTQTQSGWGRKLSRWFNETLLPELGIKAKGIVLHSTRGTFITAMKSTNGVEHAHVDYITGHASEGVSDKVYAQYNESHISMFKKVIERLEY